DLLTADRGAFARLVQSRLEARCSEMRLGLRLEGVSLHDLHPPQEVVQPYREVNLAQADRTRRLRDQEAKSLEVVRQAEAERFERVRMARARQVEFLARQ